MDYNILEKFDMFKEGRPNKPITLEGLKNTIAVQRVAVANAKTDHEKELLLDVVDILMVIEEQIVFAEEPKKKKKKT